MSFRRHSIRNCWSLEQLELRLLFTVENAFDVQQDPNLSTESTVANAAEFSDVPDVGTFDNWNVNAVRAPEAWAHGFTGQGVVVAVVDSGVDGTNPALLGQIWSNADEIGGNGRDDDGNGYVDDTGGWDFVSGDNRPDDEGGHGTLVAGIVAGRQSEANVIGIAPDTKIMPIRVLDDRDVGTNSSIAAGIRYAADNGADVINLSIGGAQNASVFSAIEYALARNVLVVASAGNDAAAAPAYPAAVSAALPNLISVGAYRAAGSLGGFSNAVGASGAVQVDAPGINILSTSTGLRTLYQSGTSLAAPHVAGLAALALSANPHLSASELRNLIVAGAEPTISGSDSHGAVNAARTVAAAARLSARVADTLGQVTPNRSTTSPPISLAATAALPIQGSQPAELESKRVPTPIVPSTDSASEATQTDELRSRAFAWLVEVWRETMRDATEIDSWLDDAFLSRTTAASRFSYPSRLSRSVWR
jgi:subtilisin family serine protease